MTGQSLDRVNIRKWFNYIYGGASYRLKQSPKPSRHALSIAYSIRGKHCPPAIFIHALMPRSGTVYVGELLRLHPDVHAYPFQIWEVPFLQNIQHIERFQQGYFEAYVQNIAKIGNSDFKPIFGSSLVALLSGECPDEKRILLKVPSIQYLSEFFNVFPHEQLLVLVRDGRDVVASTIRTWPRITFTMACLRWRRSALMVLYCDNLFKENDSHYQLCRFEDAVIDRGNFMHKLCEVCDLDVTRYPFDRAGSLPVIGSTSLAGIEAINWEPRAAPATFSPTGYWREWSRVHKWLFELIAGDELRKLGYTEV